MELLIGWLWPYLVAACAAVLGAWQLWASGKRAGRNEERATNAAQREKDIDRIKRAADARPSGSMLDDPYNRDNT